MTKAIPPDTYYDDRSGIETDWECGMKYWWNRFEAGRGIVLRVEADYFKQGSDLHHSLSQIAEGQDYHDVRASIVKPDDQPSLEAWMRLQAWLTIFGRWIWPEWMKENEVVKVESEMILDRPPLWLAATPDLILRHTSKANPDLYGKLIYKEYKSTGDKSPGWVAHWPFAIQVHIGLKAVEEEMGEPIAYGQIIGLDKGYVKYGRMNHPYVWAYRTGDQWSGSYRPNWDHAPIWDYEGGLDKWIDLLGEDKAKEQFIYSAPIFLDSRMLEQMVNSRIRRQIEIAAVKTDCIEDFSKRVQHFEQRFSHCKPSRGRECPFLEACFNKTVQDDPLSSGLYQPRTPHHDVEIGMYEEAD